MQYAVVPMYRHFKVGSSLPDGLVALTALHPGMRGIFSQRPNALVRWFKVIPSGKLGNCQISSRKGGQSSE